MAAVKFSKQGILPNPIEVDYWVDIKSDPYGSVWKYFNGDNWVSLDIGGGGSGMSPFDYYTKELVNDLLNDKATIDSVESKVDDDEVKDLINNISFSDTGDSGVTVTIFKYNGTTVAVPLPIASSTVSGIVTSDDFIDFVKQHLLQQLYTELYDKLAEIREQYQPRLKAGENIIIDRDTNTIHAIADVSVDWNKIVNIPEHIVTSISTEEEVINVDELIVNQLLRKNEQILTESEQAQVRTNLDVAAKSVVDLAVSDISQLEIEVDSLESSKVDKETGKGLSTNDYTTDEKAKLSRISDSATKTEYTGNITEGTVIGTITIDGVSQEIKSPLAYKEIENFYSYGVEFDTTVSSPTCTRIGNPELHRTLPVHNLMRGCLLADDGTVNKYLNESTWVDETRDGSQGQVMVELPEHYRKFETDGTKRRVRLSLYPLFGYHRVPKQYVSAYEASLQRSTLKLSSVVNTDADYRGGNNTSDWDDTYRTLCGMPATSINRTNFKNYARNRNTDTTEWNPMVYSIHKELCWLFVVEYATLNTQATYNAELDTNGYKQGGLDSGVATWDWTSWVNHNNSNPFIPCGYTDSLGNFTGVINYNLIGSDSSVLKTFSVPRYRGIENPFGHIWQWAEGINVRISPTEENGGDALSKVFVCDDPSKFSDTGYDGYTYVGNMARFDGWIKELIFGNNGEIAPTTVGGGSSTFFCDYHRTNIPTTETLRGVLFGGHVVNEAKAGLFNLASLDGLDHQYAGYGSRLCFIPKSE